MASIVFYFSGTGNSLHVAKALAGEDQPINAAISPIKTYTADSIGFVYPSYCGEPPRIIKDFVKNATFNSNYLWAVVTHGGAPNNALGEVDQILKQKGSKLNYGAEIRLPDSVIIFKTPENTKQKLLANEAKAVEEIRLAIQSHTTNTIGYSNFQKHFTKFTWFGFKYILGTRYKKATSKCINCTQCVKQCPTKDITIKNGRAKFGKNCEYCFGCIQYCPNNAIKFGFIKRKKDSQYNHPQILAKEMIKRNKE